MDLVFLTPDVVPCPLERCEFMASRMAFASSRDLLDLLMVAEAFAGAAGFLLEEGFLHMFECECNVVRRSREIW